MAIHLGQWLKNKQHGVGTQTFRVESNILGIGTKELDLEKVLKFILMEILKRSWENNNRNGLEFLQILRVIFLKEIGKIISGMVREFYD